MIQSKLLWGVIAAAMMFSSCDEQTYGIGDSLINDADQLEIEAKTFSNIATRTVKSGAVLAPTRQCYFGKVKDPETNSYIKSEFTTQFKALESTYISPEENIIGRYNGRAAADSCDIVLFLGAAFKDKDSLFAMKMRVSELDIPIEENQLYYTDFDPASLVRADGLKKDKMFSYADLNASDAEKAAQDYMANVRIKLNSPYTAKDGTTYNNYGTYVMQQYYDHPEYFTNAYLFNHYICPGFYFQLTSGLGVYTKIYKMGMNVYYRVDSDEDYSATLTFPGTEEVLQTIKITNDENVLNDLESIDTCTYMKTPAGLFTEVTLPVEDIMGGGHQNDSLVGAKISFQRINNNVQSEQSLGVPSNIIMLPKDSITNFFEQHKSIDSKTVFTASLGSNNAYVFNNISNLVANLWKTKTEGEKEDSQWTANHPDWNKVLLVPVSFVTSTSSSSSTQTITRVNNSMSLSSTMLVGGSNNRHDPIELHIVYAKFKK